MKRCDRCSEEISEINGLRKSKAMNEPDLQHVTAPGRTVPALRPVIDERNGGGYSSYKRVRKDLHNREFAV